MNYGFGKGINVWSVFKRNKLDKSDRDGNPLVYALKNEKGWKFKTNQDRKNILYQMNLIIEKFFKANGIYSPTVVIPSGSQLNTLLANVVKKYNPQTTIINDLLSKMGAEDVYYETTNLHTPFRKVYNTKEKFLAASKKLWSYCQEMIDKRNGLFTFHLVKDNEMRTVISRTLKLTNSTEGKYSEDINNKDILIIDDTISQGNTIKYACDSILETFYPKSITVLTMFSKL
jgi:phosphoribosylpyrophosphate synthetase